MNLKLKKELCGRIYPLLRRSLGRLPPWIPMFRKELCAPRFCAIRAFRVKNEFYHFGAEILNTEYTDVYCKGITRST